MAKIALIFLLFALFAVAMSASVPSGEASNPVEDVANQIAKAFRENTTPEKIEELKEKFGEFWNAALESAKKISAETNQKIQEFENKAH